MSALKYWIQKVLEYHQGSTPGCGEGEEASFRKLPGTSWSGDPAGPGPLQCCSQSMATILAPSTILTGILLDQLQFGEQYQIYV